MSIDPPKPRADIDTKLGNYDEMNLSAAVARKSTIAIVGGSYVGMRLAQAIVPVLPPTHRVVVVEANSHFHHLFTFPRFSVLHRAGEEKALVPYTYALDNSRHNAALIHAKALSIHTPPASNSTSPHGGYLKLDRPVKLNDTTTTSSSREEAAEKDTLEFDYLAIATGTRLQEPWSLSETKLEGVQAKTLSVSTIRKYQDAIQAAQNIVIVGGGAVGVQVAFDIAEFYSTVNQENKKRVTIVHSRANLMNKFHSDLHNVISKCAEEKGVGLVLGKRVKIPASGSFPAFEPQKVFDVELQDGSTISDVDLVLMCTGQTPRSDLLAGLAPQSITKDGFIDVRPTMQLRTQVPLLGGFQTQEGKGIRLEDRIFALGDIANSGAAKTVRAAMGQIDVIKNNLLTLISREEAEDQAHAKEAHSTTSNGISDNKANVEHGLQEFQPGPAGIHLSLGLYESIKFGNPALEGEKPRNMGIEKDLALDMNVESFWSRWGIPKGTPWHL